MVYIQSSVVALMSVRLCFTGLALPSRDLVPIDHHRLKGFQIDSAGRVLVGRKPDHYP